MLGFSSSLMMSLTHYGTGTAPIIWFGLCHAGRVVENGAGDECGQPDHLGVTGAFWWHW